MLADIAASFMAFIGPLLVNSFGHLRRFGYETYPCGDSSRNVWFVALLSMGEGWHNNHHAFPQSARHGLRWYELDLTWATICLLKLLGIARDIRLPKAVSHLSEQALESAKHFQKTQHGLIFESQLEEPLPR